MRDNSGGRDRRGSDVAGATAVSLVFLGLVILTALLAAGFYVHVTGGENAGDPTKVDIAASTCTVSSDGDVAGVGTVTLSARYRGNGTVDLSNATIRYRDERTDAVLDVARDASATTVRVRNDSGAYDPTIARGELVSIVLPVEAVRGGPLPSGERATLDLAVEEGTIASTSIRTPGGVGPGQAFVDC